MRRPPPLAAPADAARSDAPRPVIVVAGLLQSEATVAPLADALRAGGLDVTVWLPPGLGLGDIPASSRRLGRTVDAVRRRTGATQVDLVGHSQGGLTARYYVKSAGGAPHVHTLVALGSPQQGTVGGLLSQLLLLFGCLIWAPACRQMVAGSCFLADLNGGDPTPGGVRYVTVGSRQDGVVQPVQRAGIPGGENLVVQEACPGREVGHFGLLGDAWVQEVVGSVLAGGAACGDCAARPTGALI